MDPMGYLQLTAIPENIGILAHRTYLACTRTQGFNTFTANSDVDDVGSVTLTTRLLPARLIHNIDIWWHLESSGNEYLISWSGFILEIQRLRAAHKSTDRFFVRSNVRSFVSLQQWTLNLLNFNMVGKGRKGRLFAILFWWPFTSPKPNRKQDLRHLQRRYCKPVSAVHVTISDQWMSLWTAGLPALGCFSPFRPIVLCNTFSRNRGLIREILVHKQPRYRKAAEDLAHKDLTDSIGCERFGNNWHLLFYLISRISNNIKQCTKGLILSQNSIWGFGAYSCTVSWLFSIQERDVRKVINIHTP